MIYWWYWRAPDARYCRWNQAVQRNARSHVCTSMMWLALKGDDACFEVHFSVLFSSSLGSGSVLLIRWLADWLYLVHVRMCLLISVSFAMEASVTLDLANQLLKCSLSLILSVQSTVTRYCLSFFRLNECMIDDDMVEILCKAISGCNILTHLRCCLPSDDHLCWAEQDIIVMLVKLCYL